MAVWHTCFGEDLCHAFFVRKNLQYSESPWIFSPTNVSKASESLIKFALDTATPPAFSPTFMKNVFHLISAAGAAEKSAEGSDCSSPNSRPSSIDVFRLLFTQFSTFVHRTWKIKSNKFKFPVTSTATGRRRWKDYFRYRQ